MGDVMEKLIAKREKEAAEKYEAKALKAVKAERINFAKEMLANNENLDKVVQYTKLSLKEVRALAATMTA